MENNNPHQLKDEARSVAGSGCYEMNIKTRPQEERHIMVIQLGNNDVILGRGTGPNEFEGNRQYRKLLRQVLIDDSQNQSSMWYSGMSHQSSVEGCSSSGSISTTIPAVRTVSEISPGSDGIAFTNDQKRKAVLARQVVQIVKSRGGRFLQLTLANQERWPSTHVSNISYKEVDDSVAIAKTKQGFRHQIKVLAGLKSDVSSSRAEDKDQRKYKHREGFNDTQESSNMRNSNKSTSSSVQDNGAVAGIGKKHKYLLAAPVPIHQEKGNSNNHVFGPSAFGHASYSDLMRPLLQPFSMESIFNPVMLMATSSFQQQFVTASEVQRYVQKCQWKRDNNEKSLLARQFLSTATPACTIREYPIARHRATAVSTAMGPIQSQCFRPAQSLNPNIIMSELLLQNSERDSRKIQIPPLERQQEEPRPSSCTNDLQSMMAPFSSTASSSMSQLPTAYLSKDAIECAWILSQWQQAANKTD